ncbi:MAG: metalloregulator ArsR/SmtB family transcription factor [bacterium]
MKKKIKDLSNKKSKVDDLFLDVNSFLKVIADDNRLKIVMLLKDESMNVTDIYNKLGIPQNLASHHISKLKSLDLLLEKRNGTFRNYTVNIKKIRQYNVLFKNLLKL